MNRQLIAQQGVNIGTTFKSPFGQEGSGTIGNLVTTFVQAAIVVAGIVGIFLIVSGGYFILIGAGERSPDRIAKGQRRLTFGIIGFIIIFAAFWVIQIIEGITGSTFITSPNLNIN